MSVRDVASVTVSEPVDGTRRRRRAGSSREPARVERGQVPAALLEAARAALRPGERLVVESATCVRLVNR